MNFCQSSYRARRIQQTMKPNRMAGLLAATLMISAIMAIASSFNPTPQNAIVYYVSTEGNDAWSGTIASPNAGRSDGPFRTVAAARDAIRRLRAKGPLEKPVFVYIRGGIYFLDRAFGFQPAGLRNASSPVVYAAYPGETPVLSGGREIRGWAPERRRNSTGSAQGRARIDAPPSRNGTWSCPR